MEHDKENAPVAAEIQAELENGTRPEFDLDDTSFMLPTTIDRAGLSRMINDLLGLAKPVAFDIFFRDEPLRTTLAEKLEKHNVESETTIKLVYTLAVTEPEEEEVDMLDDWISGIAFTGHLGRFATSCFDGNVSVYGADGNEKVHEFVTPDKSATAVALHSSSALGEHMEIVCGHINGLLEVYCLETRAKKANRNLVATSHSDHDTIQAIAIDEHGTLMAAAGGSGNILVYDNAAIMQRYRENAGEKPKSGKRAIEGDTIEPVSTLVKHTKTVTALKFVELTEPVLISASIDGSIALWDARGATALATYGCGRAITCFDFNAARAEIYTGYNDGTVAVWELRGKGDGASPKAPADVTNCNLTLRMSTAMFGRAATAIKVNPENPNLLSAVALDGTAVLLDRRSIKIPLQTASFASHGEPDRCTGTCWISAQVMTCTTAAGQIRQLTFKELA